jgi:Ca2+-binding RTX toxin-like protein
MAALFARSVVLAGLILVATAGAAQASSVTVGGGVMTITANAGEENEVFFSSAGSRGPLVPVNDSGSEDTIPNGTTRRIVAGGSCNQTSDGRGAFCPTDGLTRIVVNLADEDDTYEGDTMAVDTELTLGDGDDEGATGRGSDVLHGGNGADTLDGGPASSGGSLTSTTGADALDTFDGGPGTDTIDIGRSTGADDVSGGPDADTVTYASRSFAAGVTTGVTVTIDDVANDGRQSSGGEKDRHPDRRGEGGRLEEQGRAVRLHGA